MNAMFPGMENEARSLELSQFYTPPPLAAYMASLVDLKGKRVLEPSAGSGNLVRAALDAGARTVDAVDIEPRNVDAMRNRRFDNSPHVYEVCADFLGEVFAKDARHTTSR